MFRYLAQERGLGRIGIVHDENVFGQLFRDRLVEHAAAFGYAVVGSAAVGTRNPEDLTREGFVDALEAARDWNSGGVLPAVALMPDDHHAQTAGFLCERKAGRFVPLSDWIAP